MLILRDRIVATSNDAKDIKKPSLVDLKKARESLHKKFGKSGYTDEHFKMLKDIDGSIAEYSNGRKEQIKAIKDQIKGAELEITDLYSKRELAKLGYVLGEPPVRKPRVKKVG